MNKIIITMISIIVVLIGIITAVAISGAENTDKPSNIVTIVEEGNSNIEKENNMESNENTIETNSEEEEKISPNCVVTEKIYYKGCSHTTSSYNNIKEELVNKTKKEFEKEYSDWQIEKFTSNEIVIYKEVQGDCGEHYIVRSKNGQVIIYQKTENGEEEYLKTDISTEYLPETDRLQIERGIEINGKQQLNQLMEDYE